MSQPLTWRQRSSWNRTGSLKSWTLDLLPKPKGDQGWKRTKVHSRWAWALLAREGPQEGHSTVLCRDICVSVREQTGQILLDAGVPGRPQGALRVKGTSVCHRPPRTPAVSGWCSRRLQSGAAQSCPHGSTVARHGGTLPLFKSSFTETFGCWFLPERTLL